MDASIWKQEQVAKLFINQVRGSIPLAAEQIAVMRHLAQCLVPRFGNLLDLGCGDGILGHALLELNPGARATFLDFSEPLLQLAKQRLASTSFAADFACVDYGQEGWQHLLPTNQTFDLIVSGFSIHHQPDARKQTLYGELFQLLNPGGLFLNLEHVQPGTQTLSEISDLLFIEGMVAQEQRSGGLRSREQLAQDYRSRQDKDANILAPLDQQCAWLRDLGFENVDCYFKMFELALFGGQKPKP